MKFEEYYGDATPENIRVAALLPEEFSGWNGMFRPAMVWTATETAQWGGSDLILVEISYVQMDGGNMSDEAAGAVVKARYVMRGGVVVNGDPDAIYNAWYAATQVAEIAAIRAAETAAATIAADQKSNAVARINAALEALEAEGFAVNAGFRKLYISNKGAVSYSGHCKMEGQSDLARQAVSLCSRLTDDALIDEVAAIIGVGE